MTCDFDLMSLIQTSLPNFIANLKQMLVPIRFDSQLSVMAITALSIILGVLQATKLEAIQSDLIFVPRLTDLLQQLAVLLYQYLG